MKYTVEEKIIMPKAKKRRRGISVMLKLVGVTIPFVSITIAVLLYVLYTNVSQTLLEKSETLLHTTSERTIQTAWHLENIQGKGHLTEIQIQCLIIPSQ